MIVTELVFVRHGQAVCNAAGVVGGPRTCTGLTDLGRQQVHRSARHLAAEHADSPFAAVYAGPRLRLQQTGQLLAAAVGLPLRTEPGLDGPVHGQADGRPWTEVKTAFGGGVHVHPDRPWAAGSDTWNGYLQRAGAFLAALIDRHDGERVLFAAHGETVLSAHALLLSLGPGTDAGFTVDHGSLSRWQRHRNRFGRHRWLLERHNDTAHLTPAAGS
ncbi:histidine phosphatase family protein [Planotetraspora mira]|uniref:Phosphoglycerate mutase n=1 Tax=Planotetraspora mira TaxID=58121 RepID=A0A8J3XB34_9ACTN|nr:histidine phosphatase family protein [Planotetraspora mira]GII34627.1 phosphoglycerate mutase [Planotetraspora mira]